MVCSPQQSRLNALKSTGPKSDRGKAIAARNTTKHGLLAQKPPLLVTEDLSTFEGLLQSLIDHYQPENPVEHFLTQQVAMGMFKQYRLWGVEAAIGSLEILKAQRSAEFPDHVIPARVSLSAVSDFTDTHIPCKTVLQKERKVLQDLVVDLEFDLSQTQTIGAARTLKAFAESLKQNHYYEDRKAAVWQSQDRFDEWLSTARSSSKKQADFQEAIAHATRLLELAQQRIVEIDQTLGELEAIDRKIQQARIASQGMPQQELFNRYQRSINRELHEAIDRLEKMSKQRQNQGSIGSFGQITPLDS